MIIDFGRKTGGGTGGTVDIIDNLTSTRTDAALSAKQGKVLNEGKQAVISDLTTIRNGAASGATALQAVPDTYATKQWVENKGYITGVSLTDYYTSAQTDTKISTAIATETARTESTYLKEHQSLANYYTSAQTNSAISTATSNKVSSTTVTTIWKGTQAQYDAITTKDNNTMYVITAS